MCTKITMKDLIMAHHEMAHVHYFIQYRNQPKVFRDGANPGMYSDIHPVYILYTFLVRYICDTQTIHQ